MKLTFCLLKSGRITKNGYPAVITARHKGKVKRYTFKIYSHPEHWDFEKEEPTPTHPHYHYIYPEIRDLKHRARKLNYDGETSFLKIERGLKGHETINHDFYHFAEKLILEKIRNKNPTTAQTYRTAINQLKQFSKDLEFEQVNYNLMAGFKNWKLAEGSTNITVHSYLRRFRAIYNEAVARGITKDTQPFKMVFKGLKIRANRTKKKYLDISDIKTLETAQLSGLSEFVRDLFLLQFYFGGQDLIDIYFLKKHNIQNGRVYFIRTKMDTTGAEFDLMIPDKAQRIINKYMGPVDIFPGRKDWQGYKNFRRRYAKKLIDIQTQLSIEVKPKLGNLGIKVARHTFANIGKRKFIEDDLLRELMGHERDDVDNYYKDRYPEAVRDAAQKKIIKT